MESSAFGAGDETRGVARGFSGTFAGGLARCGGDVDLGALDFGCGGAGWVAFGCGGFACGGLGAFARGAGFGFGGAGTSARNSCVESVLLPPRVSPSRFVRPETGSAGLGVSACGWVTIARGGIVNGGAGSGAVNSADSTTGGAALGFALRAPLRRFEPLPDFACFRFTMGQRVSVARARRPEGR
jgi:hypothetical protein